MCGTDRLHTASAKPPAEMREIRAAVDKRFAHRLRGSDERSRAGGPPLLVIPTVFHVIWHEEWENVSDDQIGIQLAILNEDFRKLNPDAPVEGDPFFELAADVEIEFCLAQVAPGGMPTDGITRTYTDSIWDAQSGTEPWKFTAQGGEDNWDPTHYMNIWVVALYGKGQPQGQSTYPWNLSLNPELDGLTVDYQFFGSSPENGIFGRACVHEVGHWLGLLHPWADANCGDDMVDDTPPTLWANYDCPEYPHNPNNLCGSDEQGEMFMNYMDYTSDECQNMFTIGQVERIWANIDLHRPDLLSSTMCDPGTASIESTNGYHSLIGPVPTEGPIRVVLGTSDSRFQMALFDMTGRCVMKESKRSKGTSLDLDLTALAPGPYELVVSDLVGRVVGCWTVVRS